MKTLSSELRMITNMDSYFGYESYFIYEDWRCEPLLVWAMDKMSKAELTCLLVDPSPKTRALAKLKLQLEETNAKLDI